MTEEFIPIPMIKETDIHVRTLLEYRSLLKDFALTLTSDLKKLNSSESLHIFNLQKIKSEQNLFSQKKRISTSVCYDHDL